MILDVEVDADEEVMARRSRMVKMVAFSVMVYS